MARVYVVVTLFLVIASGRPSATADAQAAEFVGHGFAPVAGTRLYYEVKGNGPPVVLIHGGQMDSRMWDDQVDVLAKRYTTIRYDVRGYGGSAVKIDKLYSNVGDLEALLTYLQVKRAHIVGLSLGGRIAVDYAITHPERILTLTLAGPGLTGFELSDPAVDGDMCRIAQAAMKNDVKGVADLWLKNPYMAPAMRKQHLQPRLRRLVEENAQGWLLDEKLECSPVDVAEKHLGKIKRPTLLILGTLDVCYIKATVGKLRAGISGVRFEEIKDAGHMVNMENPGRFNDLLLDFLDKKAQ